MQLRAAALCAQWLELCSRNIFEQAQRGATGSRKYRRGSGLNTSLEGIPGLSFQNIPVTACVPVCRSRYHAAISTALTHVNSNLRVLH
jgi:hypothetical protein